MAEIAKLHRLLGPARSAIARPINHEITALVRSAVPKPLAARTLKDGNIAFKVTYNDRGWANVCSPDAFQFNVFEKKTFWCCEQSEWPNSCQSSFYRGKVLSADLYPCYDSVALATLSFSPGWNHGTNAPHVCKEAGEREGTWAVKVSGNWRVTFVFRGEDAELVDYEDYH